MSSPAIKPIETVWKDYRFRSRLEARWAVFFESLELSWEYEPEGFVLPSGRYYLPDFKIHGIGWFEIKPVTQEININIPWPPKGSLEEEFFSLETGGILYGLPGAVHNEKPSYGGCCGGDSPYFFCECPECAVIGFEFDGRSARVDHKSGCPVRGSGSDKNHNADSLRILTAASIARSARFEHGEHP
jgi:hypothetical protein